MTFYCIVYKITFYTQLFNYMYIVGKVLYIYPELLICFHL